MGNLSILQLDAKRRSSVPVSLLNSRRPVSSDPGRERTGQLKTFVPWTRDVFINKADGRVQDAIHHEGLNLSKWTKAKVGLIEGRIYENKSDIPGTSDSAVREHPGEVAEAKGEVGTPQKKSPIPILGARKRTKEKMNVIDVNKSYRYRDDSRLVEVLSNTSKQDERYPVVVMDMSDGSITRHTKDGRLNFHEGALPSGFDLIEVKPVWNVECWIDTLHPNQPPGNRLDAVLLSSPQAGNIWRYRRATLIEKPANFDLYQTL
jgi:hypothetical protein